MRRSSANIPDENSEVSLYYSCLWFLDTLISALIVAPCVVGYWRSVWCLMDIYVYPQNDMINAIISTVIGICGHIFFTIVQKLFENYFHPDKNRILFYVVSRLYTACFAFACVNGWRGPWQLLTVYTKYQVTTIAAITLVGVVALMAIRAIRNITGAPFLIVTDSVKGYFEVLTMFRVPAGDKTSLYILDCLFSVLVVGTLVVFVWRGAWVLIDIFLFPEDEKLSAWGSLILGYITVAIAFLMQPMMRWICDRATGASRLFVADFFILFAFFGTVNVWRGIWNLLNLYFLPDNLELSCWITHWVCLVILVLLGCSNSLLVRGVYIDAEEPAGKCVVFPCYYLRVIFQQEKMKNKNPTIPMQEKIKPTQDSEKKIYENNHIINVSTIESNMENHAKS